MQPSSRHANGSPRAVLRTAAAALAAAALLAAAGAGPALASARPRHTAQKSHHVHRSHASRTSHQGWVKYFIVGPPRRGAKEFLFEIAAATLGRGSLSAEIFRLNKGRLQPDGGRLENPTVIHPGWILVLPSDAHGRGVHFGRLPAVRARPSLSPSASPSLSASPTARPAPVRHRSAAAPAAGPSRRVLEAGIGGAAVVVLMLLIIGFLLMRRRRSRRLDPARPSADGAGGGRRRPAGAGAGTGRRGARRRARTAGPADPGLPVPLQATVLARDPAPLLGEPALEALPPAGQPGAPGPLATPAWLAPPAFEDADPAAPAMPALAAPGRPAILDGLDDENVAWPDFLGPADSPAAAAGQAIPVVPGLAAPGPAVPDLATDGQPTGPAVPAPAVPSPATPVPVSPLPEVAGMVAEVPAWLAQDSGAPATEPSVEPAAAPPVEPPVEPPAAGPEPEPHEPQPEAGGSRAGFSPVALRLLGAQRSAAQRAEDADGPVQRHTIGSGEDRIEIVLAEAPAADAEGRPRGGHTWLTAAPYLVWTPLPYDAPEGGTAFACLGVGDEGCLFIDLAAAPGAVAIGGDRAAARRLAESVVHQLGMSPASGQSSVVIVVGGVVPEPHPAAALSLASLGDLASASGTGAGDATEIVFSELRSDEDAFALARYVASNQRRVVPVVLADLPDAPWSFTARPGQQPGDAPEPARSSDALDPASA